MHADARRLEPVDNPLPLQLRTLEIQEQRDSQVRSLQVVDALRHVLRTEFFGALKFHDDLILNQKIRKILAHRTALV
jgi:hypothetical protein